MRCCCCIAALLLVLLRCSHGQDCPEDCTCHQQHADCSDVSLSDVPSQLPPDITSLDLSHNNLTVIHDGFLENLPLLTTLLLNNNALDTVEPAAFQGLPALALLDLHENFITQLHPGVFRHNRALSTLDLSSNRLLYLEHNIFASNSELLVLNVSRNELGSKEQNVENADIRFPSIPSLTTLDLSGNLFTSLPADSITSMASLSFLDISGNIALEYYDCDLRALWSWCFDRNVTVLTDDPLAWDQLQYLNCEDSESVPLADEYLEVSTESEGDANNEEGSGGTFALDPVSEEEPAVTEGATEVYGIAPEDRDNTEEDHSNWILVGAIAGSVFTIIVLIVLVTVIVCRHRKRARELEPSGGLSHARSFDYLRQDDIGARGASLKTANRYDRVMMPPGPAFGRTVLQVSDDVIAEVTRVPSFKNRGVSTPLNLPEELPSEVVDTLTRTLSVKRSANNSLPRYNFTPPVHRAGSVKRS